MIRLCAFFLGLVVSTGAWAQACYQASVVAPAPFLGNHQEIVKLSDGSIWQVQNAYEYMYEYYPAVTICPRRGVLVVGDRSLDVQPVGGRAGRVSSSGVIESTIVSRFSGLNAGNVYRLANGQIWEQTEAWVWAWAWANPAVLIYLAPGGYKMKVENIEQAVFVRQIK